MDKAMLHVYDLRDQGIRMLEEERRRIARDLHDGPVQALTNISMKLEVLKHMLDSNPQIAKDQVDQLHRRVTEAVKEIRALIYDLRPLAVDEVGLIEATKALCSQFEKNWGISTSFVVQDGVTSAEITPAKQVALYRLIQEILNNIKKHARATTTVVEFLRDESDLIITVKDDGVGFDTNYVPPGHYGLIGMKERAEFLGGQLEIHSIIGQGSTFIIRIPMYTG